MGICDACGNEYDRTFEVKMDGSTHTFDSFECAIHMLGPTCEHCGIRVIGHGVEVGTTIYCCANCAEHAGASSELRDHVGMGSERESVLT